MKAWLAWELRRLAWPYFRCEQCVGQAPTQGCLCAFYDYDAPRKPPGFWRRKLRNFLAYLGMDSL